MDEVVQRVLPSGVRLVGLPRPGAPLAAVRLRVLAGSRFDPPGMEGVAHLVEHLVVRCSMGGGRLAGAATVAAATAREYTDYHIVVRPGQVAAAGRLLGAVFAPLAVPPRTLAGELSAVRRELAERLADDRWRLQEALFAGMWRGTRYAHSILGTPATLAALTPAAVRSWHAEHYLPRSATLAVAAGDPAGDLAALATVVGRWPSATASPRPAPPELPCRAISAAERAGPRRGFGFAITQPAGADPAALAFAREAVRAGQVDLQQLALRGRTCTWVMLRGPDAAAATRSVSGALVAARRAVTTGAVGWPPAGMLIPLLRSYDQVEALPRLWLDRWVPAGVRSPVTGRLAAVTAAEVLAVIDGWRAWVSELADGAHTVRTHP
jgi:insulinase (Peptidase family M16)